MMENSYTNVSNVPKVTENSSNYYNNQGFQTPTTFNMEIYSRPAKTFKYN
jgi:hypothetical protein